MKPMMLVVSAAALVCASGAARAQVYSWTAPVSGDWGMAANWSPVGVPNGLSHDVVLGHSGSYVVSFSGQTYGVFRYTASNPQAVLRIDPPAGAGATRLGVYGPMLNDGLIRLEGDPASDGEAVMQVNTIGRVTLDGSGELRMEEAGDAEIVMVGSDMLVQGPAHAITGAGTIRGAAAIFFNEGDVLADRAGGLTVSCRTSNSGMMRASGAGRLVLSGNRVSQITGGTIEADGAPVVFTNGGSVWFGVVRGVNGGVIEVAPGAVGEINGVYAEGNWVVAPSPSHQITELRSAGSFTNAGLIRVASGPTSTKARFVMRSASTTIDGTGELRLEEAEDTDLYLSEQMGWIANGAGHTISGVGLISSEGCVFHNAGILAPGTPLGTLSLLVDTFMQPTSVLKIELGGDGEGQRDKLELPGPPLALGGTLEVRFRDGYELPGCAEAVVVRGPVTGEFDVVDLPVMPQGLMHVRYSSSEVKVGYIPGDMNGDGLLDFADYLEFLNLFDGQDARADLNGDGLVDFVDYLEFLNLYEGGC